MVEQIVALAILWPAATLVLTAVLFGFGIPLGRWHLWVGLAVAVVALRLTYEGWRDSAAALIVVVSISVVGGSALAWLLDFSGDGQWYHLPAVVALSDGWNPFAHPQLGDWNPVFKREISERLSAAIYVQHYPKGAWIVAAAAYRATGLLEAAKVVGLLYLLAVFFVAAGLLRRLGASAAWRWGLALAAAANPVLLYQVPVFFVDGQVAALCTLLVLLSLDYIHQQRPHLLALIGACVVLLANVKFTGVVFAVALGFGCVSMCFLWGCRRAAWHFASAGLLSVALAIGVGYQPYITNVRDHGNPFYPVIGRDSAAEAATSGQFDIWAPPQFMSMGRMEKLARSLLSESGGAESMPSLKPPFTVKRRELYIFFNAEPRYGGFGPLFASVVIASLLLLLASSTAIDRGLLARGAFVATIVFGSALLNPEAWWARLSPQLWLVPVVLLATIALGARRWARGVGAVLLLVLLSNAALVAALNWGRSFEKNRQFRTQLALLTAASQSGPLEVAMHPSFRLVTEHRLREHGVDFRRVPKVSCPTPLLFSFPAAAQSAACPPRAVD
jgi:hypothetical protein